MTTKHWHDVKAALAAVLEAPPSDRADVLNRACARDPALRTHFHDLQLSDDALDHLLHVPTASGLATLLRAAETAGDSTNAPRLAAGTRIGPYTIERLLGVGGMGEVYLARDPRLHRHVALKCVAERIADDPLARGRVLREARAAARLTHPNIAHVNDVLDDGGRVVIVMEYVEGRSLAERLREGACDVDEAVDLAAAAADALHHAHAAGIVHCDIKPSNIQLTGPRALKILDFGVARSLLPDPEDATATTEAAQVIAGTPGYMAPEQALGQRVDARSDIFSLGVVLFEMLTGQRPFAAGERGLELLNAVFADAPDLERVAPSVPAALRPVVVKAIHRDPAHRFQSAAEFRDALAAAVAPPAGAAAVRRPPVFRRWIAAAAVIAVLALIGVGWRMTRANISLRIAPEAERWYTQGISALQEGAYREAERALQRAISIDGSFPLAWARLGEAQLEIDQELQAQQSLLKAAALVPDRSRLADDQRLSLEAAMAMASRDARSALDAYTALSARQPKAASLLIDLGRAHEALDAVDKALEQYLRASQLDPENPAPFLRAGVLYSRMGKVGEADGAFRRAEELYKARSSSEGLAAVAYERGVMYTRAARTDEAIRSLGRALQLAESSDTVHLRATALFRLSSIEGARGRYAEAEARAREGLKASEALPGVNAFGLVDLGNIFVYSGKHAEAERHFRDAVGKAQRAGARRAEARARLALAALLVATGRVADGTEEANAALAYYERTRFRAQADQALTLLASAHEKSGDLAGASTTYAKLLDSAIARGNRRLAADHRYRLCVTLASREQYVAALPKCDESIKEFTELKAPYDVAHAMLARTDVLWRLGRLDEAQQQLESVATEGAGAEATRLDVLRAIRQARIALALNQPARAARLASAAAKSAPADAAGSVRAALQTVLAVALARSGSLAEATHAIEDAQTAVVKSANPAELSHIGLGRAEVLLRLERYEEALKVAGPAAGAFARQQRHESAWMAARIAARAAAGLKRADEEARWRAAADTEMKQLLGQFDAAGVKTYQSRGDLRLF